MRGIHMQRLLLSMTLASAVSLSAVGNSNVTSRSMGNTAASQASVSTDSADKANILTRAATSCKNASITCKDFFVNNARIFAHTGVAAITLPSVAYLAQYIYDYWYEQLPDEPTTQERVQLYAAACGTAFGIYYTMYQFDVAPHQLAARGYTYCHESVVDGYQYLVGSQATS